MKRFNNLQELGVLFNTYYGGRVQDQVTPESFEVSQEEYDFYVNELLTDGTRKTIVSDPIFRGSKLVVKKED